MDMMGMVIDMKTINYVTGTVLSVNDKNETEWTFVVDSMIIDSKQGGENMYVNTNDKTTITESNSLTDGVGKLIQATVDAYGRVTIKEENAMSTIVKACFIEYAGQAITAKQNWKIENEMNMMGKNINMSTAYIIKSQDDKTYTVQASAEANVDMLGKIPAISNYVIDKKTGMIVSSSTTMEITKMGDITTNITYVAKW
jgi:hypothetical protein